MPVENKASNIIPEVEEDSSILKRDCYDPNDPDILALNNYFCQTKKVNEIVTKRVQEVDEENFNESDEQYVKNVDNENDDEDFEKFENPVAQMERKYTKRTIQSAHPSTQMKTHFSNLDKKEHPTLEITSPRLIEPTRPTTVPAEQKVADFITSPRLNSGQSCKSKGNFRKGATPIPTHEHFFSVVGKRAKISERDANYQTQIESNKIPEKPVNKKLRRSLTNRTALRPTTSIPRSFISSKKTKNIATQQIQTTSEYKLMKNIQQINIVTARPNTSGPNLMDTVCSEKNQSRKEKRPQTAYVKVHCVANNFISSSYMRPFGKHKKPISAAVSMQASQEKDKMLKVNPMKNKMKYTKYLEQLEKEAKQFVIEEDSINKKEEPKNLMEQAKLQHKKVKLKKKIGNIMGSIEMSITGTRMHFPSYSNLQTNKQTNK